MGRNQLEIHWRKTSSGKGMCELCIFYSSAPVFVDFARRFFNIHLNSRINSAEDKIFPHRQENLISPVKL